MELILWRHSLTVCYQLLRLLNDNLSFTNVRIYILGSDFRINALEENSLGVLLQQEPFRIENTTVYIDADYSSEHGGNNRKFVIHFSNRFNTSKLSVINTNVNPPETVATHSLNPTDPVNICATSFYEQLMSTYND